MSRSAFTAVGALVLAAVACTGTPSPTASPLPTRPPTQVPASPTPTPAPTIAPTQPVITPSPLPVETPPASAYPEGSVIVTFQVEAEQFKALLTDPEDIDIAEALLAGEEAPTIPNGVVVRNDPGVNAPWTWHLDPLTIEFADVTVEVCDGLPSYVEAGTVTSDRFCPWGAEVIAVEPAGE